MYHPIEIATSMFKPTMQAPGFTLAELLIVLMLLGEIATFTIPKVITAQQTSRFNAVAKEDISAISAAYTKVQAAGAVTTNTSLGDITQYLNYVATDTSSTIDSFTGSGSGTCTSTMFCLRMHNGSIIRYRTDASFGGTSTTHGLWFHIDPDGVYSGTTDGPGKLMLGFIYYNGRIADGASIPASTNTYSNYTATSTYTPAWFSW
jgi:prepilin-type N-terminal cleavage/methylation domain-containing protein